MPLLPSMSDARQDALIKCAERTIELMNAGVHPNAALLKVAKDEQLNDKEVVLVSAAVNNSKAVSQLVNAEKPEDKEKPFLLTNAEVVNQNLYEAEPTVGKGEKQLAAENKKEAAARSNIEDGYYLDDSEPASATNLDAFFGVDTARPQAKVAALTVSDDLKIDVTSGLFARAKLAAVKRAAGEASEAATAAQDAANVAYGKVATLMRRADAPRWNEVEKIARVLGVSDDGLDYIFNLAKLASFGHTRDNTKVAGVVECTRAVKDVADLALQAESFDKRAAACLDVVNHLLGEHDRAEAKLAADAGAEEAVNHVSTEIGELPDKLTGAAFHNSKAVDLLGAATDSAGEAPQFDANHPPLGAGTRQEAANIGGRTAIEKMMADDFIGHHPVTDVVAAFNRASSANPNLGEAELHALVKQDLASGGNVPLDTLSRVAKGKEQAL